MRTTAVALACLLASCGEAAPPAPPRVQRLVSGALQLVGSSSSACSHGGPGQDTWCAFFRAGASADATELWTLNVTRAVKQAVACDGSSPDCLRLTSTLWTGGLVFFSPAHPAIHGFQGTSLFFYSDGRATGPNSPF